MGAFTPDRRRSRSAVTVNQLNGVFRAHQQDTATRRRRLARGRRRGGRRHRLRECCGGELERYGIIHVCRHGASSVDQRARLHAGRPQQQRRGCQFGIWDWNNSRWVYGPTTYGGLSGWYYDGPGYNMSVCAQDGGAWVCGPAN